MGAQVVISDPLEVLSHQGWLGPWPHLAHGPQAHFWLLGSLIFKFPASPAVCQGQGAAGLRKALSGVLGPEGWVGQEVTVEALC